MELRTKPLVSAERMIFSISHIEPAVPLVSSQHFIGYTPSCVFTLYNLWFLKVKVFWQKDHISAMFRHVGEKFWNNRQVIGVSRKRRSMFFFKQVLQVVVSREK